MFPASVRIGGCVSVNLLGVDSACVLAPNMSAVPPGARERTRLDTVIEAPGESVWLPMTYCDWAFAVILRSPSVITGAGVA